MIFSIEINENSKYSKCFNESVYCKSDSDYNLLLLRNICQFENDKLVENGYLFLNDVYEDLGLPKTKEGQLVGWIFDKKNPNGDNYVDFGLSNLSSNDKDIFLSFNIDGVIIDRVNFNKK